MNHTKEPWKQGIGNRDCDIDGPDNLNIAVTLHLTQNPKERRSDYEAIANARRIVACVNTLAGMSTELIDNINLCSGSITNRIKEQRGYLESVENQRDQLLDALKEITSYYEMANKVIQHMGFDEDEEVTAMVAKMNAAIAAAEGAT